MSGGLRAPGLLWLAIIPFFGANLLEKRGFFVGILLVAIGYLFFLIANYFNFEMYPLVSIEHYLIEFRMNLLLFTLTTFSLTYFHVVSTSNFVNDLKKAKDRNENFFRILFHDLANPMQIIQMLIRKKHSNRTPEENEKIFLKIEKTSSRIVEIMEHVRKIKAVEDKNINLALEKVLIYPVVKSIKEELEKIGIERNIELVILNSPDNETSIFVDRSYFKHQILKNIISNAIKFSEDSGKIQIGWTIVHKKVEILIKDDGIGMPSEIKDHLFDKMKVASRRGVNGEIGTGYGLDIAKVFIEEFGGTMDIESFEKIGEFKKEGTTVILRFPI
jgi:signal transduction histidine kinase